MMSFVWRFIRCFVDTCTLGDESLFVDIWHIIVVNLSGLLILEM
jgi:hypothetical protein